ncbi:MAG TPA: hypothetical protein VFE57_07670 [Cyclobacteriaceae bacterium]|jgi:hypothetical protein|nr:hypothetical protein [Cyclobacteriaceae bacterium]
MKEQVGSQTGEISIEHIIENIKAVRDQAILNLLKDHELHQFLEEHYEIFVLSPIRTEFLKRDLRELRNTSLDLVHYSSLIKQLKERNISAIEESHGLIISELKRIFEKVRG